MPEPHAANRRPRVAPAHLRSGVRGFTLVEVLIALALVTLISLVVLSALGPWLRLKQSVDNERKLQAMHQAMSSYYRAHAFALEEESGAKLGPFENAVPAAGQCSNQREAFAGLQEFFPEGADESARDGYRNPFCLFVSKQLEREVDGHRIYYHVLALVSPGPDGVLDAGTQFDPDTGALTLGETDAAPSDDRAILVNGYDIQLALYRETMSRMTRIVDAYETYFTARYLADPERDITRYYFATNPANAAYDHEAVNPDTGKAVTVPATDGGWRQAEEALSVLGLPPHILRSAWERDNDIEVGTLTESAEGIRVKSPYTSGTGVLPYTALVRAALPGANNWAVQVAVGHY